MSFNLISSQSLLFPASVDDRNDATTDPDGDLYCRTHDPLDRRPHGITLTPSWLVERMLDDIAVDEFDTIVDCGAGTGRFSIAVARRFPKARVLAVELHPDMLALLRRRLWQEGLTQRVEIIEGDFRSIPISRLGRCLFIGNPPYVRHHDITTPWKAWYRERMQAQGIVASQLAGLHLHFLMRAAELMRPGDELSFVTSAEWLDNGYGDAARALLARGPSLQLRSLWVAEPDEAVFPDALVSCTVFRARCADAVNIEPVRLGTIAEQAVRVHRSLPLDTLAASGRWSSWCRPVLPAVPSGIELGDLFQITRGQVTGGNQTWVLAPDQTELPASLTVAAVTRAREIIDGAVRSSASPAGFKQVVNLPRDLDSLPDDVRGAATRFVARAREQGADQGYIARHRKPWFALGMRRPPAAFVSYMGRRPPVFMPNPLRLSFINIAHGLYPREPIASAALQSILDHLNATTDLYSGRVYGGGMAKFEPSDVARLRVPEAVLAAV